MYIVASRVLLVAEQMLLHCAAPNDLSLAETLFLFLSQCGDLITVFLLKFIFR